MIFFLASSESATLLPAHTLTTRSAFFSAGRFPLRLAQLEIAVTLSTMRMFCLCFLSSVRHLDLEESFPCTLESGLSNVLAPTNFWDLFKLSANGRSAIYR